MALDEAQNVTRARSQTDHAMLHVLSAAAKTMGVMGYKAYGTSRKGSYFHLGLFDGKTGALLCLMQADYLGQMRTVCNVRKIRRVQVYSLNEANRRRFAAEMSELCQTEVEAVPRPEMAAEDKDIVITATNSREPVLNGHWIAEGTHINAIGSNFLGKAELDAVTVRRCETIVVDSKDQARIEAGDFVQALEEGSIHWADIHELGQVIVGRYTGRAHPQDVTLFKSLGIAVEDMAVAARVYAAAQAADLGQTINW
jgi:ornithine cyclodeaminase/alanine dehydrogenase-like protein (mu-crystallin family)